MALGANYATRDELKARMSIDDDLDNDTLDGALATASRWIEKHTGRQFNTASVEQSTPRLFRPATSRRMDVDDIATAAGLLVETDAGDGTFAEVASGLFQIEPVNGVVDGEIGWPVSELVTLSGRWPCDPVRYTVRVTATWGWAAVPAPVKEAALLVATETAKLKDAPFGVAGFGEFGVVRLRDNPVAMRLLAPYRRRPVQVA